MEGLGRALDEAGWRPALPMVMPFDKRKAKSKEGRRWLAMAFLREYDKPLRAALCSGNAVRDGIVAGGTVISSVADCLQAVAGFPVPTWNIANAICQLGLTRFCRKGAPR